MSWFKAGDENDSFLFGIFFIPSSSLEKVKSTILFNHANYKVKLSCYFTEFSLEKLFRKFLFFVAENLKGERLSEEELFVLEKLGSKILSETKSKEFSKANEHLSQLFHSLSEINNFRRKNEAGKVLPTAYLMKYQHKEIKYEDFLSKRDICSLQKRMHKCIDPKLFVATVKLPPKVSLSSIHPGQRPSPLKKFLSYLENMKPGHYEQDQNVVTCDVSYTALNTWERKCRAVEEFSPCSAVSFPPSPRQQGEVLNDFKRKTESELNEVKNILLRHIAVS
eukprot:maker-scaffold_5-snap-gene-15.4-mRNA-1 protein AED:0.18 eAED:0.18 QI:229/1/1/1/1/1/3/126/278